MSFHSGHSRLIELPPEQADDVIGSPTSYVEASTAEELREQLSLDEDLLERVLYRGEILANYRILGFVGAGGMGEVYAAERLEDDGPRRTAVALKVLSREHARDDELMARLEREAEICQAIHSRHVVRIYEYGVDERGRGFMAMELLQGEELYDRMRHHKLFPLKRLAKLSVQVLRGLQDVHAAGVVHRDIKPENIFLAEDPRSGEEFIKLLDFGIARRAEDPDDPLAQNPDQLLVTPQYMSPEQTRGPEVDHLSDLYSLGVVLYECAAGNPPFDAETPYATMIAHQEESVPRLPSTLDPEFCEFIYRALAKRPEDRWQSAREWWRALERWIDATSWVDELPGEGGFFLGAAPEQGAHDDLFADILDPSPTPSSANAPRSNPAGTPMFGAQSIPQTPSGVPAARVIRRTQKPERFDQERGVFEEEGAAPPSASDAPSLEMLEEESAVLRPAARETLHSSPLELAPTQKDRQTEPTARSKPARHAPPRQVPSLEESQGAEEGSLAKALAIGVTVLAVIGIIGALLFAALYEPPSAAQATTAADAPVEPEGP